MRRDPLILVPADRKQIGLHPFQAVGEKYIRALLDAGVGTPLLLPSLSPPVDLETLLPNFDGILLTGSHSNIEPHHYSDESSFEGNLHDPQRDATTLSLIHIALRHRIPLLAVCRGFQEVNVAFGGSLLQKIHETPGFQDHREDLSQPLDIQYGAAHALQLTPGGVLAQIAQKDTVMVNSLHGQGIRRLGRDLLVEGVAPDGLIEAVCHACPDTFLLAVQWHPEWRVMENPFYLGIFQRFAAAVQLRIQSRGE
mgnify:CR=1 FL=1